MSQSKSRAASGKSPGAAARAEANGEAPSVEFHGLTIELPAKMPFNVLRHIESGQNEGAQALGILRELIGAEQLDAVFALNLDIEQGMELLKLCSGQYGTSLGES